MNDSKRNTVVYIAGAYRDNTIYGIRKNIEIAEEYALKYWKLGYTVICPHKNTALMDGALPDEVWLEGAITLMKLCDLVVFIPGWASSAGACAEYAVVQELDMNYIIDND